MDLLHEVCRSWTVTPSIIKVSLMFCLDIPKQLHENVTSEHTSKASELAAKFPNVFSSKLGRCTKFKVSLQLKPGAKPANRRQK